MQFDGQQLAAFAAVIEYGSFDAAAARLHVTPSAVSQRIKALEQRVGQVLVRREKPCVATPAGAPLIRLAAQTALLESEALAEMGGGSADRTRIAIAVNADSMATWFTAVLGQLPEVLFDVRIEDQDHSARLLREGAAMGAVTTERTPVPGCRVQPLGVMRYVPVASADYAQRYLPDGTGMTPCRTCWCAERFVAPSPDRCITCRPPRVLRPRCGPGSAGACFPTALPLSGSRMDRSSGYLRCTSTCRCTGSAGS